MHVSSNFISTTLQRIACVLIFNLLTVSVAQASGCEKNWPAWEMFKKSMISEDGRVIDTSTEAMKTTSEGQAYALFFALVANDRTTFEKLLNWTEKNQSRDDLTSRLPSWVQGKQENDDVVVLDENSASDADLWMAYALGEAGRLWSDRRYVALSSLIATRILASETRETAGLGLVLLPGAVGFTPSATQVRLNPSYAPLQLMHWFSAHSHDPRWAALLNSSRQLILKSSPKGYAPDWILYEDNKGFFPDTASEKGSIGSYDAIRVYLWAGMLNSDDEDRQPLLDALKPMARFVETHGAPPESIHTLSGTASNEGPTGFSAAMLPFLQSAGMTRALNEQKKRIEAKPIAEDSYYDQVLSLFALGWHDNLYHFDSKGNLTPRWISTCP